uniref:Uncharacterized protein n=1 Tax=Eutreptiella gymnastica TaxID=73025 RepID=A0A7S1J9N8_9EUGL|mmetsp:Transcript_77706/g.136984  ORF Transcript_77706/g.136984 Transcript_77706/m.136984 type:complete len:268 (+) Transcript_77706:120-923(+)
MGHAWILGVLLVCAVWPSPTLLLSDVGTATMHPLVLNSGSCPVDVHVSATYSLFTDGIPTDPTATCSLWSAATRFVNLSAPVVAFRPIVCMFDLDGGLLWLRGPDSVRHQRCMAATPPFLVHHRILSRLVKYINVHSDLSSGRYLGMSVPLLSYFMRRPGLNVFITDAAGPMESQAACSHSFRPLYVLAKKSKANFRAIVEPDGTVGWLLCARNAGSCLQEDPSARPEGGGPPCCAYLLAMQMRFLRDFLDPQGAKVLASCSFCGPD